MMQLSLLRGKTLLNMRSACLRHKIQRRSDLPSLTIRIDILDPDYYEQIPIISKDRQSDQAVGETRWWKTTSTEVASS
jgi:hypothetical protein